MIRRWSCINIFNLSFKEKKTFSLKKTAKSRIFKLSVSTRKFNKKYTKFRRKAFNRLRHRSNWMIYSNIFKFWSQDYLANRSFIKKNWLLNVFKNNFIFFNWSSCKNQNIEIFFNFNFNFFNINFLKIKSNDFLTYGSKKNSPSFFLKNASVGSYNDEILQNNHAFSSISSLFFYENLYFDTLTYPCFAKMPNLLSLVESTNNINTLTSSITLNSLTEYYTQLILLTLIRI